MPDAASPTDELLLRAASDAWPALPLPEAVVASYLAARRPSEGSFDAARAVELYLCCACVEGTPGAVATFEERYFGEVTAALARMRLPPSTIDEVRQVVRHQLFVAEPGRSPRIAEFRGHGELRGWLRVVASRAALRARRGERRAEQLDERILDAPAANTDVELRQLKQSCQVAFREAFVAALAALPATDRGLLRQHVIDGLTVDELGDLLRIHRATAARRIARTRERLLRDTRQRLMKDLRIDRAECESVLRAAQSQLHLTLERYLRDDDDVPL